MLVSGEGAWLRRLCLLISPGWFVVAVVGGAGLALHHEQLNACAAVLEFTIITIYGAYPLSLIGFTRDLEHSLQALGTIASPTAGGGTASRALPVSSRVGGPAATTRRARSPGRQVAAAAVSKSPARQPVASSSAVRPPAFLTAMCACSARLDPCCDLRVVAPLHYASEYFQSEIHPEHKS